MPITSEVKFAFSNDHQGRRGTVSARVRSSYLGVLVRYPVVTLPLQAGPKFHALTCIKYDSLVSHEFCEF